MHPSTMDEHEGSGFAAEVTCGGFVARLASLRALAPKLAALVVSGALLLLEASFRRHAPRYDGLRRIGKPPAFEWRALRMARDRECTPRSARKQGHHCLVCT